MSDDKPTDLDDEKETLDGDISASMVEAEMAARNASDGSADEAAAEADAIMGSEGGFESNEGDLLDDLVDDATEALLGPMEDFAPPGDFPQNWTLLFCCVGWFIGAMFLPIEGDVLDLYAKDSISGGFLTVLAAYGIMASYANIYHRKMIMWPVLFAMFDGFYISVRRIIQLMGDMPEGAGAHAYVRAPGPGCYVILVCSLLVLWTLFQGVKAGAAKEKARKEAQQAGRKSRTK